jgi:hypothetical protein
MAITPMIGKAELLFFCITQLHIEIYLPTKFHVDIQRFFHFFGEGDRCPLEVDNAIGGGILFVYLFYIVFFAVENGSNSCNTSLRYVSFS